MRAVSTSSRDRCAPCRQAAHRRQAGDPGGKARTEDRENVGCPPRGGQAGRPRRPEAEGRSREGEAAGDACEGNPASGQGHEPGHRQGRRWQTQGRRKGSTIGLPRAEEQYFRTAPGGHGIDIAGRKDDGAQDFRYCTPDCACEGRQGPGQSAGEDNGKGSGEAGSCQGTRFEAGPPEDNGPEGNGPEGNGPEGNGPEGSDP